MTQRNANTPQLHERVARILAGGKSALLLHRSSRGPYTHRSDTTHVQRVGEKRYRSARWYRGRWGRSENSAEGLECLLAKIFNGNCSAPSEPRRVIGDDSVLKGSVCWVPGMAEPGPTRKESAESAERGRLDAERKANAPESARLKRARDEEGHAGRGRFRPPPNNDKVLVSGGAAGGLECRYQSDCGLSPYWYSELYDKAFSVSGTSWRPLF